MVNGYGAASSFTAQFAGPVGGAEETGKIVTLTIPVNGWKNAVSPYTQKIEVEGTSANSLIDLAADSAALNILSMSGSAVYLENDAGSVTAVAVGGKPKADLVVQAVIREGVVT